MAICRTPAGAWIETKCWKKGKSAKQQEKQRNTWTNTGHTMRERQHEKTKATFTLLSELKKGGKSGEEKGWIDFEEIKKEFLTKPQEEKRA